MAPRSSVAGGKKQLEVTEEQKQASKEGFDVVNPNGSVSIDSKELKFDKPPGIFNRDELLGHARHFGHATNGTDCEPRFTTMSPSSLFSSSRRMRIRAARTKDRCAITSLMVDLEANKCDVAELSRLRARVAELEERPQYVVVERVVEAENPVEAQGTVVEKVAEVEAASDAGKISDEQILKVMSSTLKPLQETIAEHVSTIDTLKLHVESLVGMNQESQSMVRYLNAELHKVEKVDDMQSENESLKVSLATTAEAHMKMEAELAGYKMNLAEWMDDCLDMYRGALFNLVPLPSRKHAIVVALKSAPHLNGTAVRIEAWHEDRERWQVVTAQGKTMLVKPINILRKDAGDDIDAAMFDDASNVRLKEIDVDGAT